MNYERWEFCHFLDGYCIITPEGEQPVRLRAGDVFVIEPGLRGTWGGSGDGAQVLRLRLTVCRTSGMPAGRRASVLVDDAADGAAAGLVATAVLVLAVVAEIEVALRVGTGLALLLVAVLHAVVVGRALRLVERLVLRCCAARVLHWRFSALHWVTQCRPASLVGGM